MNAMIENLQRLSARRSGAIVGNGHPPGGQCAFPLNAAFALDILALLEDSKRIDPRRCAAAPARAMGTPSQSCRGHDRALDGASQRHDAARRNG